jgi:HD-GYP domain-containing protein (c-di-GMP phosphodiesterase class II)
VVPLYEEESARPTKAAILGALSQALDLVEGQPEGHALRTCLIALKVADNLGLDPQTRADVFFASLLKDSGCSNNAVRIHKIFGGDEFLNKRAVKFIDWTNTFESLKFAISHTERGKSLATKLRRMVGNLGPPDKIMKEVTEARCTRGALISRKLGFGPQVAAGIQHLDEHWDGKGAPVGIRGEEIPIVARVVGLAQTFEVYLTAFGLTEAYDMLRSRSGRWFDPSVVSACIALEHDREAWRAFGEQAYESTLNVDLPDITQEALDAEIDEICEAFAMIIDAKSQFTASHSDRVTRYSLGLADWFGFSAARTQSLRRASLMHDIGKLAVPSGILEKPGRLDDDELKHIRSHPEVSERILSRVPTFSRIAEVAGAHHERLDGKGYYKGKTGNELDLEMRILTASDVFDALTAKRPYRDPIPVEEVIGMMQKESGTAFDPEVVKGLKELYIDGKSTDQETVEHLKRAA